MAEGVACGHGICVVSQEGSGQKIIDQLPKLTGKNTNVSSKLDPGKKGSEGDMKIAFRYKNLSTNQNAISQVSKHNHYFDISKTMDHSQVHSCDVKHISVDQLSTLNQDTDVFR